MRQPYKPHTPLSHMLLDGWSRDFNVVQTVLECSQMGICIHPETVLAYWARLDEEYYNAL